MHVNNTKLPVQYHEITEKLQEQAREPLLTSSDAFQQKR